MHLNAARQLHAEGRYADLLAFVVREAPNIEASGQINGLRPWFDTRATVAFMRIIFDAADNAGDLYANLVASYPDFRPGLIGAAIWARTHGDCAYAIGLLERALAPRPDDLFVQELLADAHLALNGSRGGQAPPENWRGRYCSLPFEHFEPIDNGEVFVCCPTKVPFSLGNIYRQSIDEIWNSPVAQALRTSILDGSFRYCSKMHCSWLLEGSLPAAENHPPPPPRTPPQDLVLNHDRSCNLSCPSCRSDMIVADQAERDRLDLVRPELVKLANQAARVTITNAGDPFASKHYRQFLQELRPSRPGQELTLYTNGLLFTRREWEKLSHLHSMRVIANVSIDAACAETYHELRRGGSFERLRENLAFISQLRREGRLALFRINMTVQARNFREMLDFAAWGRSLGVDHLFFLRLRNWGTYSTDDYIARDVCSPTHPSHGELMEILRNPELNTAPVDLGTLPRPEKRTAALQPII